MRVAVLGAGLMGHSLALVFALGGHQVRVTDSNLATLEKAGALMEGALATLRFSCQWAELTSGAARLSDYVRPKALQFN